MEATAQSLDLPEEDPAIFHFLVAYLYEDRYVPTKPLSTVLIPDEDKGKGRENENEAPDSDSESSLSFLSDSSARSRRHRERRRRREERQTERLRQKHPGMHRPQCPCPQCQNLHGPPCWSCSAPRVPPPIAAIPPPGIVVPPVRIRSRDRQQQQRRQARMAESPLLSSSINGGLPGLSDPARIKGEDMRTWLITYELNIDVYVCASKFLLEGFKEKIARATIDMLETAGADAAQIEVLQLCQKLYDGVSDDDGLLRMVFARVGFLQGALWRRAPTETNAFLIENPEVAALILKETAIRGEEDLRGGIPSMERSWIASPPVPPIHHHYRTPHPRGPRYYYL